MRFFETLPLAALVSLGGCSDEVVARGDDFGGLLLVPEFITLEPEEETSFQALGVTNGDTTAVMATWSTTGGSISETGVYTAPSTTGTYVVVAAYEGLADSAVVLVSEAGEPFFQEDFSS